MKKRILLCILANLPLLANIQAQEEVDSAYLEIPTRGRGLQMTVEGGKMNFTNTGGDYGYNGGHFYGVVGYKINPKLSAGFGLGADFVGMSYQEGIRSLKLNNTIGKIERNASHISEDLGVFKLFARGQYRLSDNRFSPFVECDLGVRITSGFQNMYGESWIFDEDEGKLSNREEYIAGSLTHLLGKPSIVNVFATPAIGLSLRTTNNSYLELKAGYTLSPYAMGIRKSTDYTFNNEQMTHIASCRPIRMSAPFVSLAFTHTFRYCSDLDESLYDATRARKREQLLQNLEKALVITGAVLGVAATTVGTINAIQSRNNADGSEDISSSTNSKNYQQSYDGWARKAEKLYNDLTADRYVGSSKTYSTDVSAYHKAQREMRNISRKASAAGKPVVESVYQTKPVN